MQVRHALSPDALRGATTEELRRRYLVDSILAANDIRMVYVHDDRLVVGGVVPVAKPLTLRPDGPVNSPSFLSRRELGVLHTGGGTAVITVDGVVHALDERDMLYVGQGERTVEFASERPDDPARLYFASAPASRRCADRKIPRDAVVPIEIGTADGSSCRRLYRVVHPDHVETANLLMGYTELDPGNTWNTMPTHRHDRRTEIYFYFGLPAGERVFHFMGEPDETRHLVVAGEQAVISPPWSIHAGAGTSAYVFCWAMAGENNTYSDVDSVATTDLR
ncbi:MAG: 5-dehydro-4-deoxy-D-glucuronate isomerase [Actinobacteria bacterium]|nr:5-dehydro-4-deoxy-D-glucuronate isomerase [Actinomycetota bacterium]